jgi:hypothetical protein
LRTSGHVRYTSRCIWSSLAVEEIAVEVDYGQVGRIELGVGHTGGGDERVLAGLVYAADVARGALDEPRELDLLGGLDDRLAQVLQRSQLFEAQLDSFARATPRLIAAVASPRRR